MNMQIEPGQVWEMDGGKLTLIVEDRSSGGVAMLFFDGGNLVVSKVRQGVLRQLTNKTSTQFRVMLGMIEFDGTHCPKCGRGMEVCGMGTVNGWRCNHCGHEEYDKYTEVVG